MKRENDIIHMVKERERLSEMLADRAERAERAIECFLARDPEKPSSWLYKREKAEEIARAIMEQYP